MSKKKKKEESRELVPVGERGLLPADLMRELEAVLPGAGMAVSTLLRIQRIFQKYATQADMVEDMLKGVRVKGRVVAISSQKLSATVALDFFSTERNTSTAAPLDYQDMSGWTAIRRFYDTLRLRGQDSSTTRRYVQALRLFFNAVDFRLPFYRNPFRQATFQEWHDMTAPREEEQKRIAFLTMEELNSLLKYVRTEWIPYKTTKSRNTPRQMVNVPEMRRMLFSYLLLDFSCGVRVSGLTGKKSYTYEGLKWSNVHEAPEDGKAGAHIHVQVKARGGPKWRDQDLGEIKGLTDKGGHLAIEVCRENFRRSWGREPDQTKDSMDLVFWTVPNHKNNWQRGGQLNQGTLWGYLKDCTATLQEQGLLRHEISLHAHLIRHTTGTQVRRMLTPEAAARFLGITVAVAQKYYIGDTDTNTQRDFSKLDISRGTGVHDGQENRSGN